MDSERPEAPRCTAKAKGTQSRCKRRPVPGADVCVMHGGRAPQVRAAAAKRIERQEAERAVVALGLHRDIEPTQALLEEVRRAAGNVAWLESELREMDPQELFWGRAQHEEGIGPEGPIDKTTDKAAVHVKYQLYLTERDALVKASTAALKAGIQERQVALAEAQALQVAGLIRRVLAGIHLTPEQQEAAHAVVVTELRALDQGATA